jgi:tetratricopeptide (TPR) repeat protein
MPWVSSLAVVGLLASGPAEWTRALERGEYARAAALAGDRVRIQPGDINARIVLARAEAAQGRFEAAYEELRKVLGIDPRSTDALYYLGITAGVLAQSEYERVLTQAPASARAHQLQGDSYEAQGQRREAEAAYKAALLANPRSLEVLVALGDLTRRDAAYDEAMAYYRRAAEIAPSNYDVLYGLGVCHSFRQEHAQAVELFRQALRREPDSAPARLALGTALVQTGQTAAAVVELEAATRLEPRMHQAYFLLGRAYAALGRSREAAAAFAKVQELIRQAPGAAEGRSEAKDPVAEPR